jgi:hypothetical protein
MKANPVTRKSDRATKQGKKASIKKESEPAEGGQTKLLVK